MTQIAKYNDPGTMPPSLRTARAVIDAILSEYRDGIIHSEPGDWLQAERGVAYTNSLVDKGNSAGHGTGRETNRSDRWRLAVPARQ